MRTSFQVRSKLIEHMANTSRPRVQSPRVLPKKIIKYEEEHASNLSKLIGRRSHTPARRPINLLLRPLVPLRACFLGPDVSIGHGLNRYTMGVIHVDNAQYSQAN